MTGRDVGGAPTPGDEASSLPDPAAAAGSDEQRMLMSEIELLRGRLEQLEEREMIYEQIDLLQQRLAALDSGRQAAPTSQPVAAATTAAAGEFVASEHGVTMDSTVQTDSSADSGPDDEEEDVWVEGTDAKTHLEELAAQEQEAARKAEETAAAVDASGPVEPEREPDEIHGTLHTAIDETQRAAATVLRDVDTEPHGTNVEPPPASLPAVQEHSELFTAQSNALSVEGAEHSSDGEQDQPDAVVGAVMEESDLATPSKSEKPAETAEQTKDADAAHEPGAGLIPDSDSCDPLCGDHGSCSGSRCVCADGFEGSACDDHQHDLCDGISCGDHGTCEAGACVCSHGFKGANCDEEPASQAVLDRLGLGSKATDVKNAPGTQDDAKDVSAVAESAPSIDSVAQKGTEDPAIDLALDFADKHAHDGPYTEYSTESAASSTTSDGESTGSIPAAGTESASDDSDRDAASGHVAADGVVSEADAADASDSPAQDGSDEQDADLHDDDDWIEGTEAKTQLEELAAEEAARAEEEELARKQLELEAEAQQATDDLTEEQQHVRAHSDARGEEDAKAEANAGPEVAREPTSEGPNSEAQSGSTEESTPDAPGVGEGSETSDLRETQADDLESGQEPAKPVQNKNSVYDTDDVVATAPSDEGLLEESTTDEMGDDVSSQPATELPRLEVAELVVDTQQPRDTQGSVQDALEQKDVMASMDVVLDSANQTETAPASTTTPVLDVDAIQLRERENHVAAHSSGTESEHGAQTTPSSGADKRIATDTLNTGALGAASGDGGTAEDSIKETEEQRLERLRAEKKALQDKLDTKKGSQKDAKKSIDETADVQQTLIKTEPASATDTASPADILEPRSSAAGKDVNGLQPQPQPQSPPKSAATGSEEAQLMGTETAPSEDGVFEGWDLEFILEAAMTIVDSWSAWWQELFMTGPKDEDRSDVKWTTGKDSILDRKELEDRFNYAGFDVGARVLQAHTKTKGARNTLMWDVDQYMSSPCSLKKKWVVLQLSEPLLVEKIMLANYEQYASTFRHFQVLGSATYPVNVPGGPGGWKLLGSFVAKDNNHAQDFMLKTPQWAKYLKVRFLSHYGHEHYCTVSSIKVFGTNMLEDMQRQESLNKEEVQTFDETGAAVTTAGKALALGSSSGTSSGGQVAGGGSASDGAAVSKGEGAGIEPEQPDNVVEYDFNTIQRQSRVDFARCMVMPWTADAEQVSLAPDCYHSTGVQMAPAAAPDLADLAAARSVVTSTSAAHAAAQAALVGAQAAADADENPFRAMTNKIRLLELNHSATVLLVQRLEAENAIVMNELQRTQTARDEAVLAAQALLSEHTAKVVAGHRELRELVQQDAIEIFERVQEAVTTELAQNFSAMLAVQDARHAAQVEDVQQRLGFYAMATILSLALAIGQCLCSVFFPVGHRGTLQTVTNSAAERPLSPWSSSEEELTGGVPSTWAHRRRRWRKRRPSDPDRVSVFYSLCRLGVKLIVLHALHR